MKETRKKVFVDPKADIIYLSDEDIITMSDGSELRWGNLDEEHF